MSPRWGLRCLPFTQGRVAPLGLLALGYNMAAPTGPSRFPGSPEGTNVSRYLLALLSIFLSITIFSWPDVFSFRSFCFIWSLVFSGSCLKAAIAPFVSAGCGFCFLLMVLLGLAYFKVFDDDLPCRHASVVQ